MLDFPSINRKTSGFKNNFLNKFVLNLNFSSKLNFDKLKVEAPKSFDNYERVSIQPRNILSFSINNKEKNIISSNVNENIIELKTISGKRKIIIAEDSISFEIEGDDYKGFDDFLNKEISNLVKILKKYNVETISLTQLRKINILGYEGVFNVQPLTVAEGIFSEQLTKSFTYIPNDNKNFERKLDTLHYNYDNVGINLVLKYGIIVDSLESGKIILDIDISKKSYSASNFKDNLKELNDKLFNVFYWAINEKAKILLRNNEQ